MSAKPPCLHKMVTHQCGTNARYVLDKCRCEPCREARSQAERRRQKYAVGILPHPMVDARPVHEHVESLIAQGMGRKRIAAVSGVPHGSLSKLIYGDPKRSMAPSRRVRRSTADRLLATRLDVADGAKVDRTEFDALVDELTARGWSKRQIAKRVTGPQANALQAGRHSDVSAGNIRILRRLLFEPVPLRRHGPTGQRYLPSWARQPQLVDPTTPGVPDELDVTEKRHVVQLQADREGLADALAKAQERDRTRYASTEPVSFAPKDVA